MTKILEVKNVTKIYKIYKNNIDRLKEIFLKKTYHKKYIANNNISFTLDRGETLGIIGVNGAGKSTILKIIAGVIAPTRGEIIRRGRVTALLELGTGFNYEQNGYDNIYLNATLIGMDKKEIDSKLEDIISFSELGEYIYEPMKTYSSGMKMRLAFSIALFSNPEILIVDEALSVGDAHFSAKCTKALKERKKSNMSIIYVSHDLNSLKLLCDRVILLNKGEIVEDGNPSEVVNTYNYLISKLNNEDESVQIKRDISTKEHGTLKAKITDVKIYTNLHPALSVASGEEIVLLIKIDSFEEIRNISSGIVIRDRFGQDIYGTNTYLNSVKINLQKDQSYTLRYSFPLDIKPGDYTLSVAIHKDVETINQRIHWIDDALKFQVSGFSKNYFAGIVNLHSVITCSKTHKPVKLLMTTSKSLLILDTLTGQTKTIHTKNGLYYGITSSDTHIYVAARNKMVSSQQPIQEERGEILKFDKRLKLIEKLSPEDFPLRDIHQIKFFENKLFVLCSYDNMVAIFDGKEWQQWYPLGKHEKDIYHFNSIDIKDNTIYLLAHNFGDSEIYSFDFDSKKLLQTIKMGNHAHNIYKNGDTFMTLSSLDSKIITQDKTLISLEGFLRGFAKCQNLYFVGSSQMSERAMRDFTDSTLYILDEQFTLLDKIPIKNRGLLLDIKILNQQDEISGESISLECDI